MELGLMPNGWIVMGSDNGRFTIAEIWLRQVSLNLDVVIWLEQNSSNLRSNVSNKDKNGKMGMDFKEEEDEGEDAAELADEDEVDIARLF